MIVWYQLLNIISKYDKYGEHRINGIKLVYITFMLFFINLVYTIPNPYFNFFYIPLTALNAEAMASSAKDKYCWFLYSVIGAIVSVFLFNILVVYPVYFLFFVFFYSFMLYVLAIYWLKTLVPIPLILSLAVYSLVYGENSTDIYLAVNNALITIFASVVILACLLLFPKKYYLYAWLRALSHLLQQIQNNFELIKSDQEVLIEPVQGHLIMLLRYSGLLSPKFPIFTIFRINLLVNKLRLISCVVDQCYFKLSASQLQDIIHTLEVLISDIKQRKICDHYSQQGYEPLYNIIMAWNRLCQKL